MPFSYESLRAELERYRAVAQIGQRYRKIDAPSFAWTVVSIGVDLDGIRHCHIVDVKDRTNIKLISEKTLTNPKYYRLITERVSGVLTVVFHSAGG